jgi:sugar lactone lactonase YvrE
VEPAPDAVAVDASGNLYVADSGSRVRRVTPAGTIETLAGGSVVDPRLGLPQPGFSGDGGPAKAALLLVTELALDSTDSVYLVSTSGCLRKIAPDGTIRTLVGNQTSNPLGAVSGLAVDKAGTIYTTDRVGNRVLKVTPSGEVNVLAGELSQPSSITVGSTGDLFVADSGSFHCCRRCVHRAGCISKYCRYLQRRGSAHC